MVKKSFPLLLLVTAGCFYGHHRHDATRGRTEPPLAREEVEQLAAAGVSDPVILELVDRRGAAPLTADDMVALKQAGANDMVLNRMIANEREELTTVDWDSPGVYRGSHYRRSYFPFIGFGFGFGSRHHRRGGWGFHFGW